MTNTSPHAHDTHLPRTQTTPARILDITPLSQDVSRVVLRLPAGQRFRWLAGQYLELCLPQGDCAFSIACAPGETVKDIELHIRHHPDNPPSLEIMTALESHPTVDIRLPCGQRYIDALPQQPVWLIAGSTGFAQAKALIEHLRNGGFSLPIRLYWGARTQSDLYLHEMALDWQTEIANLLYQPVLSDVPATGFRSGLVHEAVCEDLKTHPAGEASPLCFVSGSPAMAWTVFDALREHGLNEQQIQSDVYDYAPR